MAYMSSVIAYVFEIHRFYDGNLVFLVFLLSILYVGGLCVIWADRSIHLTAYKIDLRYF